MFEKCVLFLAEVLSAYLLMNLGCAKHHTHVASDSDCL